MLAAVSLWCATAARVIGQAGPAQEAPNLVEAVERQGIGETVGDDSPLAVLAAVLARFTIPVDSQMLVFSKTSLQVERISPSTPRALYFTDDITVGYVQGGDLEVAVFDPRDGLALYTRPMSGSGKTFERRTWECASCHGATRLLLQSVTPGPDGLPLLAFTGSEIPLNVDYRTPLAQRWGGWYVTGTHGEIRHRGNAVAPDPLKPYDLAVANNDNWLTLPNTVDRARYLTSSSDIVALMTYEHQVVVANALNRLNTVVRRSPVTSPNVAAAIDTVVAYLLFTDEPALTARIKGTSGFADVFAARGPFDRAGRSLRQFDLEQRLFRYRLSYMIYSEAFRALPQDARDIVYRKLFANLTEAGTPGEAERLATLEIVRDTKSDLPAEWQAVAVTP